MDSKVELYQLIGKGPRIMARDDLEHLGFEPHGDIYLVYDLKDSRPITFIDGSTGQEFHLKKNLNPRKKETYFTTLKELLEEKKK